MKLRHYNTEWSAEKCHQVLSHYTERCRTRYSARTRPRGNPANTIHAIQCLKGMFHTGRKCEKCGSIQDVELHHIDNDWRNNTLSNLMFLCGPHHDEIHGKKPRKINRNKTTQMRRHAREWFDRKTKEPKDVIPLVNEYRSQIANHPDRTEVSIRQNIAARYRTYPDTVSDLLKRYELYEMKSKQSYPTGKFLTKQVVRTPFTSPLPPRQLITVESLYKLDEKTRQFIDSRSKELDFDLIVGGQVRPIDK